MSEIIYGKNSLDAALQNKRVIKAYILEQSPYIKRFQQEKIPYQICKRSYLDKLSKSGNHQGIVAEVKEYKTCSVKDMLREKNGLIVMLDGLKDPHNLGAIIRTCDAAGVDGVIYKKHNAVHLNDTVAKVASGALEYVKVAEVNSLANVLEELKKEGYWVIGTDAAGQIAYDRQDYDMNIVMVIGSEGEGLSRLVKEKCDFMISLPMLGHVNSLNASVAAGILIYNIIAKRK